ncbi:ubiquitin (macronuclear) [Tetrahymena thermophila SB210]|uniref:Ubiquitin n=1 Tax=Tetrahymena thermophila (strain SB210) TaxID=312017 RepID=Q22X50_TETTS|nr:ubiquitin [Tetrahymena thermophila SB210]EAR89796.1 ubiquitin [Tetrahymena thermophila SB210]|eukprot:XP_001010041.1 ubiquitin [Tetrahymena thermophila SB210]
MELEIPQVEENKVKKFFICLQEPNDSFTIQLSQEELEGLSIKELLEKANNVYSFNHKFWRMERIRNQIQNLSKQDENEQLISSHFNLFPFYFFPQKYIFEIDVKFQEETYHFELPIATTQKNLLENLSKKLNINEKQLYLLSESQTLKNPFSSYSLANLFVANDKIFYDDKEIYVDLNLKVTDNIQLFNFAHRTDIYLGDQLISKNETFAHSGVKNGDKLYSYYFIKAQIKDVQTQIKSNFTKQEAKDLYNKYYPEEQGRIVTEMIGDTLNIKLNNDEEMILTIKSLSGAQYDLGADGNNTIDQIKQKLSSLSEVECEFMKLIFCGRQLEDNFTLNNYEIKDGSIIHLVLKPGAKIKFNPIQQDGEISINIKTLTGQTLALKCKLNQKVEQLKNQISEQLEISPTQQRLIYAGQQLEDDQQLYFYNLQRDCVVHLVQTLKKTVEIQQQPKQKSLEKHKQENKFLNIQIKTLTGKQIQLKCKLYDSVEILKYHIQDSEGIPIDQQRLIFQGKEIENDYSLDMYEIDDGDIINLVLRLRGGGCPEEKKLFVNLENEKSKKEVEFSEHAPKYRQATDGLNIEAICRNSSCKYFKKQVIIKIGYIFVEIVADKSQKINCPGCSILPQVITCGFVNCQYSWFGLKIENGVERKVQSKILEACNDKYTTYDPVKENGQSNMVEWKLLYVYANQKESLKFPKCYICLRRIFYEEQMTHSEQCLDKQNHICHIDCLKSLLHLEKKCLLCLKNY